MFHLRRSLLTNTRRLYHSSQHSRPELNPESPQYKILDRALTDFVPELGFQHKAILESSRTFGFSDSISSLFNNGTYDLCLFHLKKQRVALQDYIRDDKFLTLNEVDKLKYLVKKRLQGNSTIAQHLNQLQSWLLLPPHFGTSSAELHKLSDDLRFYSGDKANDFAWYTKRLSLSSNYVQLELFQASDRSPGFVNTLELVEKRLDNLNSFGQIYNDTEEFLFYSVNSAINLFKSQASRG